jgi:hypothetical protein
LSAYWGWWDEWQIHAPNGSRDSSNVQLYDHTLNLLQLMPKAALSRQESANRRFRCVKIASKPVIVSKSYANGMNAALLATRRREETQQVGIRSLFVEIHAKKC